jgi:hypothetical protein
VKISSHAKRRIERYGLHEAMVIKALRRPDRIIFGRHGRKIAHKFMNDRVLRVIYEENDVMTVVTVYPTRRERYEAV